MAITPSIPASHIVSVVPSVLSAGGNALDLIGLILTDDERAPAGQVLEFADAASVSDYFGSGSQMDALGSIYFLGFDNSLIKPGSLIVSRYAVTAIPAWLRGGDVSGLSLATLNAINEAMSVTIDGTPYAGTVNLTAVVSLSQAAQKIAQDLAIPRQAEAASVTGSISGTTLTVTGVTSGSLAVGHLLNGTGLTLGTGLITGTYVTGFLTGTGGAGTYTVSVSQSMSSSALTGAPAGVEYDSVQGAILITSPTSGAASTLAYATGSGATSLKLTQALGAILSQGAAAYVPATAMDAITAVTQNWASFMTTWEPSDDAKGAFANWTNAQGNRYMYVMWDTSVLNTAAGGPSPAVAAILAAEYSGTFMLYANTDVDPVGGEKAAFVLSYPACLDFEQRQGRTTAAFRSQSGLASDVSSGAVETAILGYEMNFYGNYTTANEDFLILYNGKVSGPFLWADSYVNQIWFNNQLQLALMQLLVAARSIPYNRSGRAQIEAAMLDPINQAVNFGAIQPGVTLSESQKAQINNSVGFVVDDVVSRQGWYLTVGDATPQTRIARGSPPCTLWYTDGQSVQKITLASVEVQ